MRLLIGFLLFVTLITCRVVAQNDGPHLLLTGKRLHRLKLDSGRRTERWVNFERRVKTVPDSPERGFELALYSAVTGEASSCIDAWKWVSAHPSEYRQRAIVVDWCRATLDGSTMKNVALPPASDAGRPFSHARDLLFSQIARGEATRESVQAQWSHLLPLIQHDPRSCLAEFYALFEFLDAARQSFRSDLRQDDAHLFANLPYVFLLSLKPGELENPGWLTRAGGLMMVNLDPNLQGSSFVQGWALEDPKMVREGPGVAYEFLWANPYLPGLGYYNMDPWTYDAPSGLLIARESWDADSCWVEVFRGRKTALQCPPRVLEDASVFGKLTIRPLIGQCMDVAQKPGNSTLLSHLTPEAPVTWQENGRTFNGTADPSGFFLMSSMASGQFCQNRDKR